MFIYNLSFAIALAALFGVFLGPAGAIGSLTGSAIVWFVTALLEEFSK